MSWSSEFATTRPQGGRISSCDETSKNVKNNLNERAKIHLFYCIFPLPAFPKKSKRKLQLCNSVQLAFTLTVSVHSLVMGLILYLGRAKLRVVRLRAGTSLQRSELHATLEGGGVVLPRAPLQRPEVRRVQGSLHALGDRGWHLGYRRLFPRLLVRRLR